MKCKHEGCYNEAYLNSYFSKKENKQISYQQSSCLCCLNLKQSYGITTPERDKLLTKQDNKCACCGSPISFLSKTGGGSGKHSANVDHDHFTGKVRGILCGNCNTGIGKLGDNIQGIKQALEYLERNL